jgi:membrane protein
VIDPSVTSPSGDRDVPFGRIMAGRRHPALQSGIVRRVARPGSSGGPILGDAMSASDVPTPLARPRPAVLRVLCRTLGKAWDDGIFSMAAQAAFWQALSLPPLFLGLLGALGYVGGWFGPETVDIVESKIVSFARQVFTPEVVDQLIAPTAASILTRGRADVVSVGFLIALWAGSSAIASVVDSITEAHGQYGVRHPVWQRVFSLLIYLCALVVAVFTLPIVALGPDLLPRVLPEAWRPTGAAVVEAFYYPGVGALLVVVLTTVYRAALPHSPPWRRLLPGALLAMVVFVAAATGLRVYLTVLTATGYTYGALATPIAFLLFAFLLGLSIVLGAQLNNAVQEVWPARPVRHPFRAVRRTPRSAPRRPGRLPRFPATRPLQLPRAVHRAGLRVLSRVRRPEMAGRSARRM